MTGPFIAHETLLHCPSCSRIFGSDVLLQLVPKWCNVGYDVLVYVGRALFQRYRTIEEVKAELYSRNVQISVSEISYLGYKFISLLPVISRQHRKFVNQWGSPADMSSIWTQPTMGMHRH